MLIVLSVSVVFQSEQVKSFIYNQQAQFFIYEAEEVASYLKSEPSSEIIDERLKMASGFLKATIEIYDKDGNLTKVQKSVYEGQEPLTLSKSFLAKLWLGQNIIFTGKFDNYPIEVFLTAVPVRENGVITGSVVIYHSLYPLQHQIHIMRQISLWSAVLGMVLATILSIVILRTLTKPLLKMEGVADAIANGEFGRQVPVTSKDEIGKLAMSLNKMSLQLEEKIETIERLDKTRQEFVSNVSHELRTPLTIIQSFSEAILDNMVKTDDEKILYLKNILEESERLRRLVDDLLALKGLEASNTVDETEYVLISKLVNITSGNFKNLADKKNIRLVVNSYTKEVIIYGNIDRLKQVLTNLLDNAINHTQPGGKVEISWGKNNDKEAYINVIDNGPGIPPDEIENIWERFYKIDKSRTRGIEGTGLGLAIVKKIVELHGGKVKVESTVGVGSVFTVLLPTANDY